VSGEREVPPVKVLSFESIEHLEAALQAKSKYFTLFLAWDSNEKSVAELDKLFRPLVKRGLSYLCAWGKGCEEVHDAADWAVVHHECETGELSYVVMTTSHRDESLEEAFWFFRMLAIPSENSVFEDFERFAVAVGNPAWESAMRAAATD
jgi:hypothetical protein